MENSAFVWGGAVSSCGMPVASKLSSSLPALSSVIALDVPAATVASVWVDCFHFSITLPPEEGL